MTLIKTSILSGISTLFKIFTGFFLNKIIAVYVGPAGLAYIGQFQNFIQFVMSFASGAINQGVVKYTAEYKDDINEKRKLWSTAVLVSSACTFIVSVSIIFLNKWLSVYFFKTKDYSNVFLVFGFTLIFFVLNSLLISILNGQGEIKKLTIVNITSSTVTLILTGFLSYYAGIYGALISLTIGQSVVFVVTLSFVVKSEWFNLKFFFDKYDTASVIKLSKFALMAIVSAFTVPVSQVIIRNYIGDHISWNDAGYWEGVTRISSIYLMLVTTTLSVYYLPKLSGLHSKKEIRAEILNGYKIILPLTIVGALSIYLLRDFAITILFTKDFAPMSGLFAFQLIGDVFKISSWLLAYIMVAKAMTKLFIITEIAFSFSYVVLSILLIHRFGLVGVTYGYLINYVLYFVIMVLIFSFMNKSKKIINEL